jgi:hypothetical protein
MLNGYVQRLMLAAPVDAKPAATPYVNGSSATARVEVAKTVEVAKSSTNVSAPAAPQAEAVELSLFPVNGKHEDVSRKQAPAKAEPAVTPAASPTPSAQQKPVEPAQKTEAPSVPASAAAAAVVTPTVQPALAPQWKIVSAAESLAAATAQAKSIPAPAAPVAPPAPAAQAQVPTAPVAPSPAVATTATDTNAAVQAAPQSAPNGPPPKLTPYAPAKWDVAGKAVVTPQPAKPTPTPANESVATEKAADHTAATLTAQTSGSARVLRDRQTLEAQAERRPRPGLMIGGLAAVAIVVGIFVFRPSPQPQAPSTTPVVAAPPVVAVNPTHAVKPVVTHARAAIKPALAVKPTNAAATPAPTTTPKAATPTPATAAPATPKAAAQRPAVVATRPRPAPRHISRYGKLYQPESGSVVALGGIEAFYGPRGRAVRVIWSSAEQASANVSLIDDHGSTVNSVSVRGARQSVLMYVPRGYHGGLTVQVSSIGRLGERVAQTTSLPPFGN